MEGQSMADSSTVAAEPKVLLERLLPEPDPFTLESAQLILSLAFTQETQDRVHELLDKNQEGQITRAEKKELRQMVEAGTHLAILKSKARRFLKDTGHS
jgi:hypothetical protein